MQHTQDIRHVAEQFVDAIKSIVPLGNGLINDSYLVSTALQQLVLQRINRQVFPEPSLIMDNLARLSAHVRHKQGQPDQLVVPDLLATRSGTSFYLDSEQQVWRALSFIGNSESLETLRNQNDARQVGLALGSFHRLVADLDPDTLHDTLPGFHIAPDYLQHYQHILASLTNPPTQELSAYCANFIAENKSIANDLEQAKHQGLLKVRIIHGDPKLNNFLFELHSGKIISLIDLDTVKPGLVHYDIGDCLRSSCHVLATDQFDLDICAAILASYLPAVQSFFSDYDYHYLYAAIRLIPFELGLRFYSDYLQGNRYFKVSEPEQNLQRAAQQFRLCQDIMHKESAINSLISSLQG